MSLNRTKRINLLKVSNCSRATFIKNEKQDQYTHYIFVETKSKHAGLFPPSLFSCV